MKVLMVELTALVVVEDDVDVQLLEMDVESALSHSSQIHYQKLMGMGVEPFAPQACCCPVCSSPIRVSIDMKGTYSSELDIATGVPAPSEFDGTNEAVYTCTSDPSHDISSIMELLNTLDTMFNAS